jgi:hypothetical protein
MTDVIWQEEFDRGPLIACAIHDGHAVRHEVAQRLALSESQRLREEDPFTGEWTAVLPNRVIGTRSRFEVDLNRPRKQAVYRVPADAWGLTVWKESPPDGVIARSLDEYDTFYEAMREILDKIHDEHDKFIVLDLHSYNHRRAGADQPPADPKQNPQVNIGTSNMNRERWGPVVKRFRDDLRKFDFPTGPLDVRENVKFQGGHFSRWIHEAFPDSGCALAIEFKKFFMDECTGEPDHDLIRAIRNALKSTVSGLLVELQRI